MNVIIFTAILVTNNQEYGQIIDSVLQAIICCVLLYYAYQMQVVQSKLESEELTAY